VVLLLSDGTAPEAWALARWVKGTALHVDTILTGAVRTYGADSIITDSAPGATAYSTGHKGTDKAIAVGPFRSTVDAAHTDTHLAYQPLVTLTEAAKLLGYATGLVATSNIQHATPAAFSAHVPDRSQYDAIAEQQAYQQIDVVLGGGSQYLLPTGAAGGARHDGKNLVEALKQQGYAYVTDKAQLAAATAERIWGAFAADDMAYELDRARFNPSQPTIAEMTNTALSHLASSARGGKRGFFLFVEGSKVDWAAHANDPVGVASDLIAFDDAVGVALRFAESQKNTQVIVVADHGTGGISIGSSADPNYSKTDDDSVVMPLRQAKITADRLASSLSGVEGAPRIRELVGAEWGIRDLSADELSNIESNTSNHSKLQNVLGRIISTRARIGWTTQGHTGVDVSLFAYGPDHPHGLVENTAVGLGIAKYLGFDFEQMQQRAFVDATEFLTPKGFTVTLDRRDPHNVQLSINKGAHNARLPFARNQLFIGERSHALEGIVVFAERLGRTYVPKQALDLLVREMD
jgi:alkaline phosphatase